MQEAKTYYSASKGLLICVDHGEMQTIGGEIKRMGEKHAQFREIGDFGMFTTSDPVVIAVLDKRVTDVGDVFGPEEYQKRIVPADQRANSLESALQEKERELRDSNRLIADLKQKEAEMLQRMKDLESKQKSAPVPVNDAPLKPPVQVKA